MSVNYDEKINKINNDRKLMLNLIKENLNKNKNNLLDNINIVFDTLDFDNQNIKEYKAIINAKKLIFELVEEISKATTIEEITNLRKKINYYINKIKKELIKRNVNQDLFNKTLNSVDSLRSNISMYLRFLKRQNKISEIENLFENINNLSDESNARFKKILTNELKYNKRIINHLESNPTQKAKNPPRKGTITETNTSKTETKLTQEEQTTNQKHIELPLNLLNNSDDKSSHTEQHIDLFNGQNFLAGRLEYYKSQYIFANLLTYNNNFFQNCINFFRNIQSYIFNKRIITNAERDYNIFYRGNDLKYFIDYSKKRNSIMTALAIIFESSHLSKREIECLYDHNKCLQWIIEFHDQNDYMYDCDKHLTKVK